MDESAEQTRKIHERQRLMRTGEGHSLRKEAETITRKHWNAQRRLESLPVVIPYADRLTFPRTGLPRDPYALRPHHLDAARKVLDAAVEHLDRRLNGALTRDLRHRREPVKVVHPPDQAALDASR